MGSMMGRRVTSLLAASGMAVGMLVLAVCLVGFLSSYTDKSETSAVLTLVHTARPAHVVPDEHRRPISRTAPTAYAEETDANDELTVNAGLLTALLFGFFFGAIWWGLNSASSALPRPTVSWPASCWSYSLVCFFQRRALSSLSGVFRL